GLRGLTLSQITSNSPAQAAVNQRLYGIAKYLRIGDGENVIEGEGGGVKEILRATVESDLHRPAADDTGVKCTANLWRGSAFSPEDSAWLARSSRGHELTHLQKQVLLKARDGEHWDINTLRQEFSPLSSVEAEDQLSDLVRWGLVETSFEQSTSLQFTDESVPEISKSTHERAPSSGPSSTAAEAPSKADSSAKERKLSKNAPHVLAALERGSSTIPQIAAAVGLNHNQVRYALTSLEANGRVFMHGGQGRRYTRYTLLCGPTMDGGGRRSGRSLSTYGNPIGPPADFTSLSSRQSPPRSGVPVPRRAWPPWSRSSLARVLRPRRGPSLRLRAGGSPPNRRI